MKIQIIAFLAIFALASALPEKREGSGGSHHGDWKLPAGCANYENATSGVKASDCCPGLPKVFHHEKQNHKNSSEKSSKENGRHEHGKHDPKHFCSKIDNTTASLNLAGSDGVISASAAVKYLSQSTNASYDFNTIVNTCIANAPSAVAAWNNATQGSHHGNSSYQCSNSTKLNIAIMKCIRRQLILQCPNWVQSSQCSSLMTFANSCPAYPMMDGCHKKHGEKDQNNSSSHGHGKGKDNKSKN